MIASHKLDKLKLETLCYHTSASLLTLRLDHFRTYLNSKLVFQITANATKAPIEDDQSSHEPGPILKASDHGVVKCSVFRCEASDTVHIRHTVLPPNHPVQHVLLPYDAHGLHFACAVEDP